jgi:DNA-directed RNA polymerase subunit beta'
MTTFHLGGVALGGDITSGLPRVEELLEARRPRSCAPLAPLAGRARLRREGGSTIVAIRDPETGACRDLALPTERAALVAEGQAVEAGEPLAAGPLDPRELARLRGTLAAQQYVIAAIRAVYRREGVAIDDRHLEVIARQLARLVRVTEPGDSGLLPGELVDRSVFLDAARATLAQGGAPPMAAPELVGLTEAARLQPSFLAAAAFERATLVLAEAALAGREDDLSATNARVLIGAVVPRGHPGRTGHAAQSHSGMCRIDRADYVGVDARSTSTASIASTSS